MGGVLKHRFFAARVFAALVLLANSAEKPRFVFLLLQPPLCVVVGTQRGAHFVNIEWILFENELADELLDVLLQFEGDRLRQRPLKRDEIEVTKVTPIINRLILDPVTSLFTARTYGSLVEE